MKLVEMCGASAVRIIEAAAPQPRPDEVLIEVAASALCGSELKSYRGDGIPHGNSGHEAAGVVVSAGADVLALHPGQRVGVSAVVGCGYCPACDQGRYTWCDQWLVNKHMHAEYIAIPARACHRLPDDVPWEAGVLLSGDGLGVPYHSASKIDSADIQTIAIFGLGPVGLGHCLLQAHLGRRVIAVDLLEARLALAAQLGADLCLRADDRIVEQIMQATGGAGVDVAVEAAGRPESLKNCFAVLRRGGTLLLNGEQDEVMLSPSRDFIRRDITAVGAWFYHFHEFAAMLRLYRDGLAIERLVSHQFPLSQAAVAFDHFAQGLTAKVLLRPDQSGT